MKLILQLTFTLMLFALTSPMSWAQGNPNDLDPLLSKAQVLPYEWSPGQGGDIKIEMTLPDGYHAYEDQFSLVILEPSGFKVAPLKIEPLIEWYDKFSKKQRRGIKTAGTLSVHVEAPDRFLQRHQKMKMELTYQACTDQFCLFPSKKIIEVPITVTRVEGEARLEQAPDKIATSPANFFDIANFDKFLSSSLVAGLLFVFLAGIFTSFTPCIFPMIPITLAVLGNHSEERTRLQNFLNSCVYVLGIATTYSILGLIAARSGSLFGASLGNPYVLAVLCVIFLAMALSMYGMFEIQVPAFIRNRFGRSHSKKGIAGIYLTGLFAGIVASPCVGPVLVGILTYVASTQNMTLGFLFLFVYALGLGLIFIALGLSNQLVKALPRSGPWMNFFKFVLGTLMLSAFYYYLNLLLPVRWFDAAMALGLISIGSIYGAFMPIPKKALLNFIHKGLMQAVLFIGFAYAAIAIFDLRPAIHGQITGTSSLNQIQKLNWQPFSEEALAQAALDKKPVIIDFWADWCAACHELEERTFTDPRVRALASQFVLLKFDATKDSAELKVLKQKYNIRGLPTIIFHNPNGVWIDSLTLTQYEKAESFIERMKSAAR